MKSKKGAVALILGIILVVIIIVWLVNLGLRECHNDSDCEYGYYCGSDFSCHQIPTIEKTVVQNNLLIPAGIIGLAIIIAAIIVRSKQSS